jgi:CxxC-x17-CxxC domain-containing protein
MPNNNNIIFLGETTFRNERKKFGIKIDDRRRHIYGVGKTGMGKTALLENMAIQDIMTGHGVGFVDPHGEAAENLLDFIPSDRVNDVVYFNPADVNYPIAFNVMESVGFEQRHLVASGLMGVFKKIWPDVWSARMEYILNNSILALLEYPNSTLLGINRMLADVEYRRRVVEKITDPVVKAFWVTEYARYTQRYEIEATAAIQNKVGQFISNPLIRNIIGQVSSTINMRKIMDEGKILILNLSKGRIGEDNSMLLGALLITKIQLAAMSRVDVPEEKRHDFFLYVDEFQNFATESFVNILSEARKYRLALILGHQYITQMEEEVRDAVFGNVGTIICFRVGAEDAEFLEREFSPEFMAEDLVNSAKYNIYLKLMIDGIAGRPFSAQTLPPQEKPKKSNKEKIIKISRERYGTLRKIVEDKIARWSKVLEAPKIIQPPSQRTQVLYDAKCASCGKWTKVVFPPDGVRPVYCKTCLGKIKNQKNGKISPDTRTPGQSFPQTPAQSQSQFQPQTQHQPQPQTPTISLSEAFKSEPTPFSNSKKQKKPVDLEQLREAIEKSLDNKNEEKKDENTKGL